MNTSVNWFLVPYVRVYDDDSSVAEVVLVEAESCEQARKHVIDVLVEMGDKSVWGYAAEWGSNPESADGDDFWYVTGPCECGDANCEKEEHSSTVVIRVSPLTEVEPFDDEVEARNRAMLHWNRTNTLTVTCAFQD